MYKYYYRHRPGFGRGRRGGKGYGRGRGMGRRDYEGERGYKPTIPYISQEKKIHKKSEVDEVAEDIYAYLPKINCGVCGYPTCMECARAIARGDTPYNTCRVIGPEQKKKIKEVLDKR